MNKRLFRLLPAAALSALLAPATVLAQAPVHTPPSEPVSLGVVAAAMLLGLALRAYSLLQASQRSLPLNTGTESSTDSSSTQTK
ncbi:MAG: hypothetical protein V4724_27515 [Pseudomonadota bacterium]